ncbi:hypothetical protein FA046_16305 [Pedobacter cryophilus]|uniref:YCII-related domain-containing protein n=1 Tax=Pedobacter cryophilus TaxID=2571271 RepID=A0A4V5NZ76_9SPHI|nr:hypothetical protein FA046_16305 [Pedobacter cryophilus]
MKTVLFLMFLFLTLYSNGQTKNPNYDEPLAKSLGADDYGMKMYMLVILKSGSNTNVSKTTKDSLFAGHMTNMVRLEKLNKLVVAGPFGDNQNDFRGLFILNAASIEEANELLETDPAIKAKLLKPEVYPWYGSAALPQYLKDADKIWKNNF